MLNQVVLVGRLVDDPVVQEHENGSKSSYLKLAIPRSYKNADGEYDVDFIDCKLWNNIAQNTSEYCRKGDIVGVKGRVQSSSYEKDGEKEFSMDIVAEKVTFLSSKSKNEPESER